MFSNYCDLKRFKELKLDSLHFKHQTLHICGKRYQGFLKLHHGFHRELLYSSTDLNDG